MLAVGFGSLVHFAGTCFFKSLWPKTACACTRLSFEAFVQNKTDRALTASTVRACPRRESKNKNLRGPAHCIWNLNTWKLNWYVKHWPTNMLFKMILAYCLSNKCCCSVGLEKGLLKENLAVTSNPYLLQAEILSKKSKETCRREAVVPPNRKPTPLRQRFYPWSWKQMFMNSSCLDLRRRGLKHACWPQFSPMLDAPGMVCFSARWTHAKERAA